MDAGTRREFFVLALLLPREICTSVRANYAFKGRKLLYICIRLEILINTVIYTTYHLSSAQEISTEIVEAIKVAFKGKSITITVEEDNDDYEISTGMKTILDERLLDNEIHCITSEESIRRLNDKYEL